MSTFDAEIFAQAALTDARDLLVTTATNGSQASAELDALQQDIEATLAALEVEKDGRRAQALRADLESFLPARKAAILSAATTRGSSEVDAALETALTLATRVAVIVAKSFVTRGGL
jgi:hypothetical protein